MGIIRGILIKAKPVSPGEATRGNRSRRRVRGSGGDVEWENPKITSKKINQISWVLVGLTVLTVLFSIGAAWSGLLFVGTIFGLISIHAIVFGIERIYDCELRFRGECVCAAWASLGLMAVLMLLR